MSRRHAFVIAAVLVQVCLVGLVGACADPEVKPAPAQPGSMSSGGAGGGGGGGAEGGTVTEGGFDAGEAGACNDLVNTGTLVDRTGVNGDPPVSTGGTVVDGTYDLNAYAVYVGTAGAAGPTGITAKSTIRIAAGKIDQILELGGTGKTSTVTTMSSVYTATGATFAETDLCPTGGGGRQLQFTASDPQLTLTDLSSKEAFTFAKR
jgi:hypothetical protein